VRANVNGLAEKCADLAPLNEPFYRHVMKEGAAGDGRAAAASAGNGAEAEVESAEAPTADV